MKRFKIGQTYQTRFICDSNTQINCEVTHRTAKRVTFELVGGSGGIQVPHTVKIHTDDEGEFFFPLGRYSMAPIIRA